MIPGSIDIEFQSRSFDLFPEPFAGRQMRLAECWPVDAAYLRRTDGSQFVKCSKHPVRIDANIVCHPVPSLSKIWQVLRVYLLDILSISIGIVILSEAKKLGHGI